MIWKIRPILIFLTVLFVFPALGQDSLRLSLILPEGEKWKVINQGSEFSFRLRTNKQTDSAVFSVSPLRSGMKLDSSGVFNWRPQPVVFENNRQEKSYPLAFTVTDGRSSDRKEVELKVFRIVREQARPQQAPRISGIELPVQAGWNLLKEGDTLQFYVRPITDTGGTRGITYKVEEGEKSSISIDSAGLFFWSPAYNYVDRFQQTRDKHLFIIAQDSYGNVVSEKVVISIFHKNRKPVIKGLLPFYILLGTTNTYTISENRVTDPDNDPIVFITDARDLPQGMTFSSSGRVTWSPSRRQYNQLRNEPIKVPFFVEDQPTKAVTRGVLTVEASLQDMPPDITIVPSDSLFHIDENERIHLVFHLSDPNGEDDIEAFSFVSDDTRIGPETLIKNTNNQYEFVWMPGYEFVNDPDPYLDTEIRFFVLDKSKKSKEKSIIVKVKDTENLVKKDKENYVLYKSSLIATLDLMDQLEENQKALEKELKRAKRGKKNRTLVNIGLGAITGFSPLISQDNTQKTISVIGGTTTTTLGTLEAKDVIGTSVTEISEKIKTNAELYGQLLSEGTALARRYNSKLARRDRNFTFDLEKLNKMLNSPSLSKLELDAGWENKKDLDNKRIKSVFTEFDIVEEGQE